MSSSSTATTTSPVLLSAFLTFPLFVLPSQNVTSISFEVSKSFALVMIRSSFPLSATISPDETSPVSYGLLNQSVLSVTPLTFVSDLFATFATSDKSRYSFL